MNKQFEIKAKNRQYIGLTKEFENEWKGPFTFIQAADTQFGLIDRYIDNKQADDEITWTKEIKYLRLVIESINNLQPKPKFFIICGDLVDAYPFSKLRSPQVNDLKTELLKVDSEIKLICVCGNHDVLDVPTPESIQEYTKDFGDDYFCFWQSGCKFIVLNSQLFFNHTKCNELKLEQDVWLNKELESDKDKCKHLVVFQHIPLFLKTHDEPDDVYFNIPKRERVNLVEKFMRNGVRKVFCGHYHKNAGGTYENLVCVVTSAVGAQLGLDKHGYRLVHVNENEITHKYIEVTDQVN